MNKWYKMRMLGNTSAEICIYSDIGYDGINAEQFKRDLDLLGNLTHLTLRVNSYGGEVFEGNEIYNLLSANRAYKLAIIGGIAASMASVIPMACDKVVMHENSWIMIHDPSCGAAGTSKDLRNKAELLDGIKENAIKAYQKHAKELSRDEVWDLMEKESWINAQDALTYGLIDEIVEPADFQEPNTDTGMLAPDNVRTIVFCHKPKSGKVPAKQPEVTMIKCPHCGKDVAEGLQFCGHCSKPVNQAPEDKVSMSHKREVEEARMEAQVRATNISKVCANLGLSVDFASELIGSSDSFDACVLKASEKSKAQTPAAPVAPAVGVVKDSADKFRMHASNSIQVALGVQKDASVVADVRKNPGPRDFHGLIRECLVNEGKLSSSQIVSMQPVDLGYAAIRMAAMGSSDLPAILADTMNKEFAGGFEEAPSTFQIFTKETENQDFRSKSITKLSSIGDVDDIPEGSPFKSKKFSDKKESISVSTKGMETSITRHMFVNNDTNVLSEFPRAMGMAIRRRQNKDAYDLLTFNTLVGPLTAEDGIAVFDANNHGNLKASSSVPSVTSIGLAEKMLMEMKLPKGTPDASQAYANIPAKYLITGTSNRTTVRQLFGSQNDPAATNGKQVFNPYQNALIPVFDAYLQSRLTACAKEYAWYLAADQSVMPTLTIAYLSGYRTPTLRSEPSGVGDALGIKWDIFYDWGFAFQDFRGMILNDGA